LFDHLNWAALIHTRANSFAPLTTLTLRRRMGHNRGPHIFHLLQLWNRM
jgi:hypothetical protein